MRKYLKVTIVLVSVAAVTAIVVVLLLTRAFSKVGDTSSEVGDNSGEVGDNSGEVGDNSGEVGGNSTAHNSTAHNSTNTPAAGVDGCNTSILNLTLGCVALNQAHNSHFALRDNSSSDDVLEYLLELTECTGNGASCRYSVEFDVVANPDNVSEWRISRNHENYTSNRMLLSTAIDGLNKFHAEVPRHHMMIVMLEIHPLEPPAHNSNSTWVRGLDSLVEVLGEANIYSPKEVYSECDALFGNGSCADMSVTKAVRKAGGFPTLNQLNSKFMFVLTGEDNDERQNYMDYERFNRLCFSDYPTNNFGQAMSRVVNSVSAYDNGNQGIPQAFIDYRDSYSAATCGNKSVLTRVYYVTAATANLTAANLFSSNKMIVNTDNPNCPFLAQYA